jgi:hypothetical protein
MICIVQGHNISISLHVCLSTRDSPVAEPVVSFNKTGWDIHTWLKSTRRPTSTFKCANFLISEVKGSDGFVMRILPNLFVHNMQVTDYSSGLE